MNESSPSSSCSDRTCGIKIEELEEAKRNCSTLLSVAEVKSKIVEFCNFINGVSRISLLSAEQSECEEFVFLLLNLKKNIKYILTELGKSRKKTLLNFECPKCDEVVPIPTTEDAWSRLQSHEHFEEIYHSFLNGSWILPESVSVKEKGNMSSTGPESIKVNNVISDQSLDPPASTSVKEINVPPVEQNNVILDLTMDQSAPGTSYSTSNNDLLSDIRNENNTDSGVDQIDTENGDVNSSEEPFTPEDDSYDEGDNNFRFDFGVHYDEAIERKLYPETITKAVKKYDKIPDYTIQRAGQVRAVCLLCSCDLVALSRVSKMALLDHVMGQRHIRFACNPVNLNALKKYHETWLNLDPYYQAHQVYFRPDITCTFRCILCSVYIENTKLVRHLETDPHRNRVIDLFVKGNNSFYLTDLQIKIYGQNVEEAVKADREIFVKKEAAKAIKSAKKVTDSDSSPSPDTRHTKHVDHNIVTSVENPNSKKVLDHLPNRFKGHLKYLRETEKMIWCDLCKVTLAQSIEVIKRHIMQAGHLKSSNLAALKYSYLCEICHLHFPDETLWDKHMIEGPNKHDKAPANTPAGSYLEYECTKCLLVIFGDETSIARHLTTKRNRKFINKEIKMPVPLKHLLRSKASIEAEGDILTREAKDTVNYNQLTKECCDRIEATLKNIFEDCKVYPFGSRISGLGNEFSDLDVFVDTGGMYTGNKNQDSVTQVQIVRKVAGILNKFKTEFQDVFQIPTARTPIVKLYHSRSDIDCDLSFRHGLSVENTKFIRFCLDVQPIIQPFILLLKKWSAMTNLTEHITTYALAILAIFYLQVTDYLPSVKQVRKLNPTRARVINGWDTINYTMTLEEMKSRVPPYPYDLTRLLKDFFDYYAKFSYKTDVVCPLLGHTINRSQFAENGAPLPPEMKSYEAQLQSEEPEEFRYLSPFLVQDPFDLSHNLTKACQAGTLTKFQTLCDLASKHLETLESAK